MGEVYRAHDGRLNRDVAVKALPASFAADPERLVRFQREAQVLAALSHANIAAIYGLEESGGSPALVMELIEGLTLAERIQVGPIPSEEALSIARQLAEALETAHEKGIVHRDLKPANIKITPEGQVKVLDFGLAKALATEAPEGRTARQFAHADARIYARRHDPGLTRIYEPRAGSRKTSGQARRHLGLWRHPL